MNKKSPFVLLLLALLLFACSPATSSSDAGPSAQTDLATPEPTVLVESTIPVQPTSGSVTEAQPTPLPVATSRGDDLHATDPSTVQIGAGRPVLVEFFRFT